MSNFVMPDVEDDYISYASGLERHFQETGERLALLSTPETRLKQEAEAEAEAKAKAVAEALSKLTEREGRSSEEALPERPLGLKAKLKKLLPDALRKRDSHPKSSTLPKIVHVHQVDDQPIPSGSEEVLVISTPETRLKREAEAEAEAKAKAKAVAEALSKLTAREGRSSEEVVHFTDICFHFHWPNSLHLIDNEDEAEIKSEEEVEFESYENNPFFPQNDGILRYDEEFRVYTNRFIYDGNANLYTYRYYI
ncbi:uncharacterized protein MELLADRAFT_95330 [Melampsora larici-populina 98AG31]|uniref:Uncharacterized protein n=1 Tax=Melampsora larici-populina (strain 98AG31 / pathotype 3-4-7) TaxID=747676 RepID=F4RD20_MELLP|nr:uncharacterized protein MELLADRAFT_95330 [Melampsora larici-populina 98AG31]EGG09823.1 hypothetical protein MELLADRAFT_95330 [Melampsora larici-populina 98AG31]